MADLPTHSDIDESAAAGRHGEPADGPTPRQKAAWAAIGVVFLVLFVVLHLAGVLGANAHGY
ncbi:MULTISPECIES: hypothetical protein [unclassified Streptomyces]|uniref:hypothetical protein n=1 Tax=unclassified Streptomyces TaxID=2593676 RepID=UPI002DD8CF1B|nr:hypothetical protein [Streptomyces sp. NBC_00243]WRZ17342.1 hypothetical protein OHT59_02045 [Streptomyces sp. NBC_00243]